MDKVYTEDMLKPLKKAELYEILLAKGVEVDKSTTNKDMINMILAKNPPAPTVTNDDNPPGAPTGTPSDERKAGAGTNPPPDPSATPPSDSKADDEPPKDDDLPKYTPEQLIKSSTYSHRRDVLRVLLKDGETYSHAKVAWMLEKFYEKEVK